MMGKEFKQERRILCVDNCSLLPAPHSRSIWPLPDDQTCFADSSSFELLGTIQKLDSLFEGQGDFSMPESADQHSNTKLHQAVQAVGLVLGYHPLTVDQGLTLLGTDTIGTLSVAANMFSLCEQSGIGRSASKSLWQHSLRTAWLAGHIAKHEQAGRETVLHGSIAGIFHDIGLLVLVMLESDRYEGRHCSGTETESITGFGRGRGIESFSSFCRSVLAPENEVSGSKLLRQLLFMMSPFGHQLRSSRPLQGSMLPISWMVAAGLRIVMEFLLPGGMDYLASHGLADRWPIWREYSMPFQEREQWRV